MTQQTSPFVDAAWGWSLGESGWDLGMNDSLLKYSYLHDKNIDGIVASLPAPVNGQAYFNTTDNRVYYVAGGVFYSSPVPKWFEFTIRSTSVKWQFNGTTLVLKPADPADSAYTDALKADVANTAVVSKGSAMVGRSEQIVDSIASLKLLLKTSASQYAVTTGYYTAGDGGGGKYRLDLSDTTSADNLGTIIVAADGGRWKLINDGTVSIKQFGAKGDWDGITGANDTPAFAAAVASGVSTIKIPSTDNAYQLTSVINITRAVVFKGEGVVPYTALSGVNGGANTRGKGSWLHLNHTGKGFYIQVTGAGGSGPEFRGIGTVRNQPTPALVAFTATVADYDFEVNNTVDVKFVDVCLLNPYKGIYSHGGQTRCWFENIIGQPMREGIRCDECFDIHRFDNVHFWPYWSQNTRTWTYTKANLDAFAFGRCDGFMFSNVFSIFHSRGFVIYASASGTANKLMASNLFLDQGTNGYVVDSSAVGHTALLSNVCLHGDTGIVGTNYGLAVYANQVDMSITNANISNINNEAVYIAGAFCNIGIHDLVVLDWGLSSITTPAITVVQSTCTLWIEGNKRFYSNAGNVSSRYSSPGVIHTTIDRGTFAGTTSAAGDITITFTGFAQPTSISLTNLSSSSLTFAVTARTISSVTVRVFNGTTALISTGVTLAWQMSI